MAVTVVLRIHNETVTEFVVRRIPIPREEGVNALHRDDSSSSTLLNKQNNSSGGNDDKSKQSSRSTSTKTTETTIPLITADESKLGF